jgi:hypothetical protein
MAVVGLSNAHPVQLRCLSDQIAAFALDVALAGNQKATLTVVVEEGGHVGVTAVGLEEGNVQVSRFGKVRTSSLSETYLYDVSHNI